MTASRRRSPHAVRLGLSLDGARRHLRARRRARRCRSSAGRRWCRERARGRRAARARRHDRGVAAAVGGPRRGRGSSAGPLPAARRLTRRGRGLLEPEAPGATRTWPGSTLPRRSSTGRRCSCPPGSLPSPPGHQRGDGTGLAGCSAQKVSLSTATVRAARRAPRGGACHRAEDPRLPSRARLVPIGRRSGCSTRHRSDADRAVARPRDPVRDLVELHWPALLVSSACVGLALSNWVPGAWAVVALLAAGSLVMLLLAGTEWRLVAIRARARCSRPVVGIAAGRGHGTERAQFRSGHLGRSRARGHRSSEADDLGGSRTCRGALLPRATPSRASVARASSSDDHLRAGPSSRRRSAWPSHARLEPKADSTRKPGSDVREFTSSCVRARGSRSDAGAASKASVTGCATGSSALSGAGQPA